VSSRPTLESVIRKLLERAGVPGCSVAVVDRDTTLWSKGFGCSDIEAACPAGVSTVYHLFSGTKLYTATAVLQLVERGMLDLEADVTTYLPELPQLEGINLRCLLGHTSGLKDTFRGFLAIHFPEEQPPTTAQALEAYRLRRANAPGGEAQYGNVNYAILGELISRVSGAPYQEFVRQNILNPLASSADFGVTETGDGRFAKGYISRWDPTRVLLRVQTPSASRRLYGVRRGALCELRPYNLSTASIGGLVGSVGSFTPFLQSQLREGTPLLSAETTRYMQSLVAKGKIGYESKMGVGLGWKHGSAGDHLYLNHEGGGAGFTSETRLYPGVGIGIVLAMNLSSMSKTMRVAHLVCEAIYERREALE
jgi:D-alanyl-D-alanine carboxypeptidase